MDPGDLFTPIGYDLRRMTIRMDTEAGCKSLVTCTLLSVAEREDCKPSLLTPYIVVVYIPLRFNSSQIVATGEYFENTHSYCCEICSLAFLGFKGTNK